MSDDADTVRTIPRTLGKPFRARADAEMDVVGWSIFLGLLVLLVPLLPFLILMWLVGAVLDAVAPAGEDGR